MEPVVYTPVSAVANLRRSIMIAGALAVLATVVAATQGHPLIGVCGALGLALGAINNRMLQRAVIARANTKVSSKRFTGGVMTRLGLVTGVAVVIALLFRPDGVAVFGGLAVFHVLMLIGAAVPVLSKLKWSL